MFNFLSEFSMQAIYSIKFTVIYTDMYATELWKF